MHSAGGRPRLGDVVAEGGPDLGRLDPQLRVDVRVERVVLVVFEVVVHELHEDANARHAVVRKHALPVGSYALQHSVVPLVQPDPGDLQNPPQRQHDGLVPLERRVGPVLSIAIAAHIRLWQASRLILRVKGVQNFHNRLLNSDIEPSRRCFAIASSGHSLWFFELIGTGGQLWSGGKPCSVTALSISELVKETVLDEPKRIEEQV
mmetsp:Transcript_3059/g.6350  ORF Transcript_3059/g.6350 Transcript_3059/m.6350 type:complete len:206 (+) Transcript_3059:1212-1829(+)